MEMEGGIYQGSYAQKELSTSAENQRIKQCIGMALKVKKWSKSSGFRCSTTAHDTHWLIDTIWTKTKSKTLAVIAGRGRTFTCGGATVVFEVRAVFTLVVLRAGAVVVCGQVEAACPVLTRVGRAVIDIQLRQKGIEKRAMNLIADIVSATLNRAKPTASSLQAVPGNNTRTAV